MAGTSQSIKRRLVRYVPLLAAAPPIEDYLRPVLLENRVEFVVGHIPLRLARDLLLLHGSEVRFDVEVVHVEMNLFALGKNCRQCLLELPNVCDAAPHNFGKGRIDHNLPLGVLPNNLGESIELAVVVSAVQSQGHIEWLALLAPLAPLALLAPLAPLIFLNPMRKRFLRAMTGHTRLCGQD